MQLDQVTETIAHFIGVFNVQIEKARARESYDEIQVLRESEEKLPELPDINVRLVVPYELLNWDPKLKYKGPQDDIYESEMHLDSDYASGKFPLDVPSIFDDPGLRFYDGFAGFASISGRAAPPELQPPGSLALVVKQSGNLEDNDYLNTSNTDVDYIPIIHFDYGVDLLLSRLSEVDLIGAAAPPNSEDAIADIIDGIAQSVRDLVPEDSATEDTSIFTGSEIGGTYVNGVVGAEATNISDYFPEPVIAEEPVATSTVMGEGLVEFEQSTTLEAGSNLLINEVLLANNWVVSPVFAVSGDSVTLNAINQINIWTD